MAERGHLSALRARALQWLAQREHSRQELRDKLLRWDRRRMAAGSDRAEPFDAEFDGCDAATGTRQVDGLLDELASRGLLSDARFAELRVHARSGRFGNRRIEAELRSHGVVASPELVQQLKATELQRARLLLHARSKGTQTAALATADQRLRLQRFLARRGFSAETIRAILRSPGDED